MIFFLVLALHNVVCTLALASMMTLAMQLVASLGHTQVRLGYSNLQNTAKNCSHQNDQGQRREKTDKNVNADSVLLSSTSLSSRVGLKTF